MAIYQDILDMPSTEAEPPKELPQGSYICTVRSSEEYKAQTGTRMIRFTLGVQSPCEDVDQDDLKDSLTMANGDMQQLTSKTIGRRLVLNENTVFMLKEFLDHCGVEREADDGSTLSFRQRIDMAVNHQVGVHLKHVPRFNDNTRIMAEVGRTFKPD